MLEINLGKQINTFSRIALGGLLTAAVAHGSAAPTEAAGYDVKLDANAQNLPANCVLEGDVTVEGVDMFDHDGLRGTVVKLTRPASVSARFGASGRCYDNEAEANTRVQTASQRLMDRGCMDRRGCVGVDVTIVGNGTPLFNEPQNTCTSDFQMGRGESRRLAEGSVIKGDIVVNGVTIHDNLRDTGLVVVLTQDADVTASFGANVEQIKNCFDGASGARQTTIDRFVREEKETGCSYRSTGIACNRVDVIYAPGNRQAVSLEQRIAKVNASFRDGLAA